MGQKFSATATAPVCSLGHHQVAEWQNGSGAEWSGAASSTRHCGCGLISFEIYDFELSAS